MTTTKPGGVWRVPAVLALIFLSCFASVGALIARSTGDPTFGIEPDYYAKAIAWDRSRAARAASDALGWTAVIARHDRRITVTLRDTNAAPVSGAAVEAEAFAWNRSAERRRLTLTETAPGVYAADLNANGLWQFRLRAARDHDVFLHDATLTEDATPQARPR